MYDNHDITVEYYAHRQKCPKFQKEYQEFLKGMNQMYDPEVTHTAYKALKDFLNMHNLNQDDLYKFEIKFKKVSDTEYLFNFPDIIKVKDSDA